MVWIPTYFSHSYWPEDQFIHKYLWPHFADRKFYFGVDPPSEQMSMAYLEGLMTRSNAFVAAVTYRPDAGRLGVSPNIWLECALAMRANKPRLILVEHGVVSDRLPGLQDANSIRVPFDRRGLDENKEQILQAIDQLQLMAHGYVDSTYSRTGRIGIAIRSSPNGPYTQETIEAICEIALTLYFDPHVFDPAAFNSAADLIEGLQQYDIILADASGTSTSPDILALIYGCAIPCIKLVHSATWATIKSPPVLAKQLAADAKVITTGGLDFWNDHADLLQIVRDQLVRYQSLWVRQQFRDIESGLSYFDNIGRRTERVFISGASTELALGRQVATLLEQTGIDHFFYRYKRPIETGSNWPESLRKEVEACGVFVALLSRSYLQSQWCMKEWTIAERRGGTEIDMLPFVVDDVNPYRALSALERLQATNLVELSALDAAQDISNEVDRVLRRTSDPALARRG